jgi:NADH-quinone oxidoreductase subunit E
VPFSQVMQIASFYKTFSLTPKGRHEVHVCTGMTCHPKAAAPSRWGRWRKSPVSPGETDAEAKFTLEAGQLPGQLQHRARS